MLLLTLQCFDTVLFLSSFFFLQLHHSSCSFLYKYFRYDDRIYASWFSYLFCSLFLFITSNNISEVACRHCVLLFANLIHYSYLDIFFMNYFVALHFSHFVFIAAFYAVAENIIENRNLEAIQSTVLMVYTRDEKWTPIYHPSGSHNQSNDWREIGSYVFVFYSKALGRRSFCTLV